MGYIKKVKKKTFFPRTRAMVNNSIAAQLQRLDKSSKGPVKVIKKPEKAETKMSPKDARMKEAKELIKTYKVTNVDGEPIELADKVTIKDLAYLKEYVKTHTTPSKKATTDSSPPIKPVKKSGKKRNPDQIFKNLSQDELKDLCGSEYFNLSKYGNKQELQERLGDFLEANPSSLMWFTGPQLEMLCKKNDIPPRAQKDRAKPLMAKALEELM